MIIFLRLLVLMAFAGIGHYLGHYYFSGNLTQQFPWIGAVMGVLAGAFVILVDLYFKRLSVRNILSVLIGGVIGLWTNFLIMQVISNYTISIPREQLGQIGMISAAIFTYLGAITILRGQDEFSMMIPYVKFNAKGASENIV